MKKFSFSLEKVLGIKNQFYDVKMNELAVLNQELREIENSIEKNKQEFLKYNEEINEIMKNGTSSSQIETYKAYFKALNIKEKQLYSNKADAEKRIEDKQQEIIALKSEISGLERLKEKQLAEYNKALQKQQEQQIEEFINEKLSSGQ